MKSKLIKKQVDVDNCYISYYEGGVASNLDPILFIHGWGVLVEPYQDSLDILSERYQVIAPVLPGLGSSTAPEKVLQNYNDYAKIIGDFVKKLNLKKVHIIGHSLGGAIGMALAALMPSIVRSLVVVDSTGIPLGSIPEVLLRRAIEMPAQSWQMKLQPVSAIFQCLLYNSLFNLENTIKMGFIALEQDIRPILPNIESPCLIVWGENDILTPVKFAQELSQGIKGSKVKIVEEGYHEWNLFFPDKFTAIIFDFIAEIEEMLLTRA
ncbi:alpha/beta fold hydrolase [Coleofasciculus sp. H7-2]|uniref:alpha/beta fold hydrolase n=1 Tax=Coleofasciculus sp. H7-2 TaxID=3351545 RepID=UPI00366B7DB7